MDESYWKVKQKWRVHWLAASNRPCIREYLYEGTLDEMSDWFKAKVICESCREEMLGGEFEATAWEVGEGVGRPTTIKIDPYDCPFGTPCGCEWDYEEVIDGEA